MGIRIWATAPIAEPGRREVPMCADAGLHVEDGNDRYYERGQGQEGWHWGLSFSDLGNLVSQLNTTDVPQPWRGQIENRQRLAAGDIERLALMAHGQPGDFSINGTANEPLSAETFPRFQNLLTQLGRFLANDATVLLMGCACGANDVGTRLLERLSTCWPNRTVVGFLRTGLTWNNTRSITHYIDPTERCANPGMRLSTWSSPIFGGPSNELLSSQGAQHFEYADERSRWAKVARNGTVITNNVRNEPFTAIEAMTTDDRGWPRRPPHFMVPGWPGEGNHLHRLSNHLAAPSHNTTRHLRHPGPLGSQTGSAGYFWPFPRRRRR